MNIQIRAPHMQNPIRTHIRASFNHCPSLSHLQPLPNLPSSSFPAVLSSFPCVSHNHNFTYQQRDRTKEKKKKRRRIREEEEGTPCSNKDGVISFLFPLSSPLSQSGRRVMHQIRREKRREILAAAASSSQSPTVLRLLSFLPVCVCT